MPNKSGEIFGELMRMLQGYEVEIRNETHRANLLRDARYFHLKGLEQKLVPCEKSYNLKKRQNEILVRLEDIRQSGVSFSPDTDLADSKSTYTTPGYVSYARPYTDDATSNNVLILETSSAESTTLHLSENLALPSDTLHTEITFHGDTLRRVTSLLKIIASKMGLPSTQTLTQALSGNPLLAPAASGTSEALIKVRIDADCALTIDGRESSIVDVQSGKSKEHSRWIVRRAHWRIRVEPADDSEEPQMQAVLEAVKIEAFTTERPRNAVRAFLGAA